MYPCQLLRIEEKCREKQFKEYHNGNAQDHTTVRSNLPLGPAITTGRRDDDDFDFLERYETYEHAVPTNRTAENGQNPLQDPPPPGQSSVVQVAMVGYVEQPEPEVDPRKNANARGERYVLCSV